MSASDALFRLACGCSLDGYSDCHPARHFAEHGPGGMLWCKNHSWTTLADVVSLSPLVPLS